MLAYRALRFLFGLAVRAFFRRVEVVGLEHVPTDGPVIFCGNHPNSLLDPVLVTVTCGRVVHFAAKDVLFSTAIMRWLLTRMGAVPIKRRKDHGGDNVDNDAAFAALYEVLAEGRTMGIFPEGISHAAAHIATLKTGAARVALGAARASGQPVRVVPVGLHYVSRDRFRSSVLVSYGPPIVVDAERLAGAAADERRAARDLTDTIEAGLRALTVNADDWETLRVLDGVRRLYQPPRITLDERVELAHRFNRVYPTMREHPRVAALYTDVKAYLDDLAALGLTDRDVVRPMSNGALLGRLVVHLLLLVVWLPLCMIGAPIHLPVGLVVLATGDRLAPRKDVLATTKFLLGMLLLLLLYVAAAVVAGAVFNWLVGLATLLALPLTGWACLVVLRHFGAIDRKLTALLGRFTLGSHLRSLRARRDALTRRVIETVNALRPSDMQLMFPQAT